jgi:hypothetical protein
MDEAELTYTLDRMRRDLDQFDVRLAQLEHVEQRMTSLEARAGTWIFAMPKVVDQRRRTTARLRERGLSMSMIADVLGVALATVERDLDAVPHSVPERIVGKDGKSQPSHKNGRNGNRSEA